MSEVGDIITYHDDLEPIKTCKKEIMMTVQAPKRRIQLYKPEDVSPVYTSYVYDKQAEVIKAFMEESL